jgi:cyclomaltodextrinase / maltogenic alpha-amylase / neopullulanase
MQHTNDWVPQWARQVVWYQIFPERFRNGCPENDPTLADIAGAWPHDRLSPWQIHPWTSDWYELQAYERVNGQSIWFNILRRRYGGDLQGIIDKLDYLQDLGITALYLNPVFESPSHHKYDGMVYHHIDHTLGPDPRGDLTLMAQEEPGDPSTWQWTKADRLALQLIKEVHARGMRIIFDGVFNHISSNSPFFRDLVANQHTSRYRDWFSVNSWEDPEKGTHFSYDGWYGVPELPEWRQDENGTAAGPRQYIFASTQRWMAPFGEAKDGIDGWRLDVAFCVRHPFWKEWRRLLKQINPEAYLTAEVIDSIDVIKPYLQGDEFDAVMNYNLAFACAEYFIDQKKRISTSQFDRLLCELRQAFDPGVAYVQQNLLDSHDSNRVASHIVNADGEIPFRNWGRYFNASKIADTPQYSPRKPAPEEYAIQKLLALFQMTYLGAPMIYYGDEVGMWGANDPCDRKPMVWDDLAYVPEVFLPDGSRRAVPDTVEVNQDLLATYKLLIHLRNTHPALSLGDFQTLRTDDANQVYIYRRSYAGETLVVALNNTRQEQEIEVDVPDGRVVDILQGVKEYIAQQGKVLVHLPALWGAILKSA